MIINEIKLRRKIYFLYLYLIAINEIIVVL
jgi:hypothetical protein